MGLSFADGFGLALLGLSFADGFWRLGSRLVDLSLWVWAYGLRLRDLGFWAWV